MSDTYSSSSMSSGSPPHPLGQDYTPSSAINDAFSSKARELFEEYLSTHVSRFRLTYQRWRSIKTFLHNPTKPASTPEEHKLKYFAIKQFGFDAESFVCRISAKTQLKRVVLEHDVFDIITQAHVSLLHVGKNKTFQYIAE